LAQPGDAIDPRPDERVVAEITHVAVAVFAADERVNRG
jgi:hypothetical protein